MDLQTLLAQTPLDGAQLASFLDGLDHQGRVHALRGMPRRHMAALFEAAAGGRELSLDDFVPSSLEPLTVVRHIGVNSLPLFRFFEKPMFRSPDGRIGGRNAQLWSFLTGPGYFSVKAQPQNGRPGIAFDYVDLPSEVPSRWPKVRDNRSGFSRFVYGGLSDLIRPLSRHVTIGKPFRDGKDIGQYFILVRFDEQPALSATKAKALTA